ncbi:MAG: hypothetical protein U0572_15590 [Phycisphaerales bacterium]
MNPRTTTSTRGTSTRGACVGLVVGACAALGHADILYVDAAAPPGGDGSSWQSALGSLDAALTQAANGGVSAVWVREGTYLPVSAETANARTKRFVVPGGVALVGGFAGTESSPRERNVLAHPTVLSGDLAQNDGPNWTNRADNAYHVLVAADGANVTLDGLVVRGGYADGATNDQREGAGARFTGGQVTIVGCTFDQNSAFTRGGGVHVTGSALVVSDSRVTTNRVTTGSSRGAGIGVSGGSASVDGCIFSGNSIEFYGGAIGVGDGASLSFTNCSVVGNLSRFGAVASESGGTATTVIANCEFIANQTSIAGYGAAINAANATVTVTSCEFRNNSSTLVGGVMRAFNSTVTMTDCVFLDSAAASTGGAIQSEQSSTTIVGCTFSGNSSATSGGAIYATSAPGGLTVQECTFAANASGEGGAIALATANGSIADCTFDGNFADLRGGAVNAASTSTVTIARSRLFGNISLGEGGAIRSSASPVTISDSAIVGNDAATGGAVWHSSQPLSLERCTIAGNAANVGGGVWKSASTLTTRGSIAFANRSAGVGGFAAQLLTAPAGVTASTLVLNWSCVEGLPAAQAGIGNIGADPGFVDLDGADGVVGTGDDAYSLSRSSPCVNQGDPIPLATEAIDLAGAPRTQMCRVDLGALESPYAPRAWPDCNGNGIPNDCELAQGLVADCDADGVPDDCEIIAGSPDCDGDGVPDACQFAAGGYDCNANGVIDSCEIASGATIDCDDNGIPDECEVALAQFTSTSPNFSPFGTGFPATYTVVAPPKPLSAVSITVKAVSDLSSSSETVTLSLNGSQLGVLFQTGGSDCPSTPSSAAVSLTAAQWNAIVGTGSAQFSMVASTSVSATQCSNSFINVTVAYTTLPPADQNGDGVVDACSAAGDLNGDGIVDAADLGLLLSAWGPCIACGADLDGNGVVNGADLAILLAAWH